VCLVHLKMMKVVSRRKDGGPEVLEVMEAPKPVATGQDILVKVIAIATNPVDGKVRTGKVQYVETKIVGWDCAGIVESIGEKVTMFKPGDEVYFAGSIVRNGSHAEYTLVDQRIVALKPKTLNWEQAASMPLVTLTAWEGLLEGVRLQIPPANAPNPNEKLSLLVIGGAGGVGSIVTQIAKKILKIGTVIATASRPETVEWCKRQGADFVVNHQNNLVDELTALGFPRGVNIVYCTTEFNKTFETCFACVRTAGNIIGITEFSGIDVSRMPLKRLSLTSVVMFSRYGNDEEPERQHGILEQVGKYLDAGILSHIQNHHFEWNQIREAYELQDSGKAIGKITLTVKF